MLNLYKNYGFLFSLYFCAVHMSAHGEVLNPTSEEPPVAQEFIFHNRSILKCGTSPNLTIFTLLDAQTLLMLSNFFSSKSVTLTTDWETFQDPTINLSRIQYDIPQDVRRILFLCLNWQDTKLGNLFVISDEELNRHLQKIRAEKPWSGLPLETQKKIEEFSDTTFKELIYIVLRANQAQPVRGGLNTNPSLKSIKFSWLM